MTDDKMPPLPADEALDRALSAFATACVYRGHAERMSAAAAVHEAARAYAAEQVRELVEALVLAKTLIGHPDDAMSEYISALIAKHKGTT